MYKYCIAIHVIFIGYTIKCLYMKIRTCMGLNKIQKNQFQHPVLSEVSTCTQCSFCFQSFLDESTF